ncbi:MAG TPA: UdgX family uracil-DNA binding protein [Burkholderiaceae bacterium]|nr:UdgX family uracil-DNA binding protein [Burkholderiaceae bacterium]
MQLELASEIDFDGWRQQARWLAARAIPAEDVYWRINGETSLLDDDGDVETFSVSAAGGGRSRSELRVPREFVDLARKVILHRSSDRFVALYRVLLRLKDEPRLMQVDVDPDVIRVRVFERQVQHDEHRMHAYVRFRKVDDENGPQFVAWYEPEHHIVEATAGFFARRFSGQRWAILTPERSMFWDGNQLAFGDGVPRSEAPSDDALEDLWRAYYASTFNPARVNVKVMQGHMPRKFWSQLPEAQLIEPLAAAANTRAGQMVAAEAAAPRRSRVPRAPSPISTPTADSGAGEDQRKLLDQCRNCPLWQYATQAVPGEGPIGARLMLVGEQPGDQEDLAGRPFVGPAGQLLDRALAAAGIERSEVYVTNAVKHFKYELRGKRRLHKKPAELEIAACHAWYESEVATVKPALIVAMGATAARAVLGRALPILANRGTLLEAQQPIASTRALVTVHPASLLRVLPETRDAEYGKFVADLKIAAEYIRKLRN